MIQGRYDIASSLDDTSSKHLTRVLVCLLMGFILSMVMLAGSSFVEEEHQTWQFFTVSMITALCVGLLRRVFYTAPKSSAVTPKKNLLFDAQINLGNDSLRFRKDLCVKSKTWQIIDGYSAEDVSRNVEHKSDDTKTRTLNLTPVSPRIWKLINRKPFYIAFFSLFAHRLIKSWNQTGVKRIHEPDIGESEQDEIF